MNQENLEKFYKQFGSKRFDLQHDMAQDHGKKLLELYYRSIDFIYKTITTVGIVAGFGFTAFGQVKNNTLFITGEAFLFSTIAFGIWATQKIYLNEIRNLESFYSKIRSNFSDYTTLFESKLNKALNNNLTNDDIGQLQNKDGVLLTILTDSLEAEKDRKELDFFPTIIWAIFVLFTVGGLLLLLSFLFACKL